MSANILSNGKKYFEAILLFMDRYFISLLFLFHVPPVIYLLKTYHITHPFYVAFPVLLAVFGIFSIFFTFKDKLKYLPFYYYFSLISMLSHIKIQEIKNIPGNNFHPVEYGVLSLLLGYCFNGKIKKFNTSQWILLFIFGTLAGIADEIHQYFIPGRDADFYDVLRDVSGIFLGGLILNLLGIFFYDKK